jgi:isopentenyl phosphate kinase
MELVLIKLGGSLITDKNKPYTPRITSLQQLASEISLLRNQNPQLKLIIGNGAGSFGHQSAKKYNTVDGFITDAEKLGFCLVHQDALNLNILVAKIFWQANLPVIGLPPAAMAVTHNKKILKIDFSSIENSLSVNLIPLVFGDVVFDRVIGGTILSTDTFLAELAKHFYSQGKYKIRLISAGNYPGVLDRNGQVFSTITKNNYSLVKTALGPSDAVDVTGGMAKKVEEFWTVSSLGIDCWIINGNIPGNLTKAVLGKSPAGTLIKATAN